MPQHIYQPLVETLQVGAAGGVFNTVGKGTGGRGLPTAESGQDPDFHVVDLPHDFRFRCPVDQERFHQKRDWFPVFRAGQVLHIVKKAVFGIEDLLVFLIPVVLEDEFQARV